MNRIAGLCRFIRYTEIIDGHGVLVDFELDVVLEDGKGGEDGAGRRHGDRFHDTMLRKVKRLTGLSPARGATVKKEGQQSPVFTSRETLTRVTSSFRAASADFASRKRARTQ